MDIDTDLDDLLRDIDNTDYDGLPPGIGDNPLTPRRSSWPMLGLLLVLTVTLVGVSVLAFQRDAPAVAADSERLAWQPASFAETTASAVTDSRPLVNVVDTCDALAADPDDPMRMEQGVADDKLALGRALRACSDAALMAPNNARIQYQSGRVQRAAARHVQAFAAFQLAADMDYPAAYKAIGDAYATGFGLPEGEQADADVALSWYRLADGAGNYPVAKEAITEMEKYIARNRFDGGHFKRGDYMQAIYDLRFDGIDNPLAFLRYAQGLFAELDSEQVVDHDPTCKPLLEKTSGLANKVGVWVSAAKELAGIIDLWHSDGWLDKTYDVWLAKDRGMRDTYNLIANYRCAYGVGKEIVVNLTRVPFEMAKHYGIRSAAPAMREPLQEIGNTAEVVDLGMDDTGDSAATSMRVIAGRLNVRAQPEMTAAVLDRLTEGQRISVQAQEGQWSFIGHGWVASRYLTRE